MNRVQITLRLEGKDLYTAVLPLPLEVGRQRDGDPERQQLQDLGDRFRIALIPADALSVPRQAVRIENAAHGAVAVRNVHRSISFKIRAPNESETGRLLAPGETKRMMPGFRIQLPALYELIVASSEPPVAAGYPLERNAFVGQDDPNLRTMDTSLAPWQRSDAEANLTLFLQNNDAVDRGKMVVSLVNQALEVVQKAAGSDEFLRTAVQSTARMILLDNAYIILRDSEDWNIVASYSRLNNSSWQKTEPEDDTPSLPAGCRQMLARLLRGGETLICEPNNATHSIESSLLSVDRAVASPLLDADRRIIGALYGDRVFVGGDVDEPIGDLEAALLEVMAGAVSAGILRLREEQARFQEQSLRTSMNQFFSEKVLQRLLKNEDLLQGRDAEVTVLFCDIRGFSEISERVGPQITIRWINDALTCLSQCVLDTDGVLVDYVGDELMAMWGAPDVQNDHAERACRAASAMVRQLEQIRQRWPSVTPDQFGIGIGINTGTAQVGNTGSRQKFKYGPLGSTVNIASRIQGMTKQFGVTTLISESVQTQLSLRSSTADLHHRLIAEVQPVGMQTNLVIYELVGDADDRWKQLSAQYEIAWTLFQKEEFTRCASKLISLIEMCPEDQPSVLLLQRAVEAIRNGGGGDTVIRLRQK